MESTVWKAVLRPTDMQKIMVPIGAEMLCAREQDGQICVWYRCNPSAPMEAREIAIVGTGRPAPSGADDRYLGTAALSGGALMFHVFERQQ